MTRGRPGRLGAAAAAVLLPTALVLTACAGDDSGTTLPEPSPSGSLVTLTPVPLPPDPPPTGKLFADVRQSSRDAAANQFEVWIDNDTDASITPTGLTYRDDRFRSALPGTRLREIPSQSERGFPVYQPERPACGSDATTGTVVVEYDGKEVTVDVEDEADVVGRYTAARCLEIAVAKVAALRWDDDVPQDGAGGEGVPGTLTLVIEPTGRAGHTLTIDTVSGTPVLAPVDSDVWRPEATVTGVGAPERIALPIKPNRCDDHAFLESGGATAFKIGLHLDGEPGQITLRMSTRGAANAITFARTSCGLLSSVSGGG